MNTFFSVTQTVPCEEVMHYGKEVVAWISTCRRIVSMLNQIEHVLIPTFLPSIMYTNFPAESIENQDSLVGVDIPAGQT